MPDLLVKLAGALRVWSLHSVYNTTNRAARYKDFLKTDGLFRLRRLNRRI